MVTSGVAGAADGAGRPLKQYGCSMTRRSQRIPLDSSRVYLDTPPAPGDLARSRVTTSASRVLVLLNTFLYVYTQIHIDSLFRTVSRGSRGPSRGSPGPLGSFLTEFMEFPRNPESSEEFL